MDAKELIYNALCNLENIRGIKAHWNDKKDGKLQVEIAGYKLEFVIQFKNEVRMHQLPDIIAQAKTHKNFLLIAWNLYPKIKNELRKNDVAYIDGAGNIFINTANKYIWLDGNKKIPAEQEPINRAFTKTGLKAVFLFLLKEEYINAPYREIAKIADIGLGNVNYVLNGLKEKGFLLRVNDNQVKLINKKNLLDTWITRYNEKLKPTILIGNFRFLKNEDFIKWKNLPLKNKKTQWGAEPAAALLTKYLGPEILTIYTTETKNEIIKNYRLIPDTTGNVKVYQKFWLYEPVNENVVPPLLIYTDLINTGDDRNIETAKIIFDEFLAKQYQ
jgi:hypothetical protein